jgi:peptidyl-tRNA hydrolase, PTH1 family
MKIYIGLGNIGEKYAKNRHNVGFMVVDRIAELAGTEWTTKSKLKSQIAEVTIQGEKAILAKPQTMMNLSGEAASALSNFYKAPAKDITIIYDDLDLPTGDIRERDKGSAGTHNGMKSILQHAGTEEVSRIRIGIESRGTDAPAQQDTSSYVLSDFNAEELAKIDQAIEKVTKSILE